MMQSSVLAHLYALSLSLVGHVRYVDGRERFMRLGEIAFKERSAASSMVSVSGLIGMVILIFVAAALLPDAIMEIEDANTTGWDTSAVALWGIISIVIVAAFIVGIWNFTR